MVEEYISLEKYMDKINSYIESIENASSVEAVKDNLKLAGLAVVGMILGSYDIYGDQIANILDKVEVNAEAITALQDILFTKDSNGNTLLENISKNTEAITALQDFLFTQDENGKTLIDHISDNAEAIAAISKILTEVGEENKTILEMITANESAIKTLTEMFTQVDENNQTLLDKIAENQESIKSLTDLFTKVDEDNKTLLDKIAENAETIAALSDLISENIENIDSLKASIEAVDALIGENKVDIEELTTLITDIQELIDTNALEINNVKDLISSLTTDIEINKDTISNVQSIVNDLQALIDKNGTDINEIFTTITTLQEQLTANGTSIEEMLVTIGALTKAIEENEIDVTQLSQDLVEYKNTLDEIESILGTDGSDDQTIIEKIEAINTLLADYDSYKENLDNLGTLVDDLEDTLEQVKKEQEDAKSLTTKKAEAVEEFKIWIIAYLNVLIEEYKAQQAILPQNSTFGLSAKLGNTVLAADNDEATVEAIKSLLGEAGFTQEQINEFINMYNEAIEEINAATTVEDIQPKLDLIKENLRQYATNIVTPNANVDLTYVYVGIAVVIVLLIVVIVLLAVLVAKKKSNQPLEETTEEDDNDDEQNTLLDDEEVLVEDSIQEETNEVVEEETTDEELNEEMEELTNTEDLEEVEELEADSEDEELEVDLVTGEIVRRPYKPFADRIIETTEQNQYFYNTLKNELLSYRKIRSRISKKCDNFRLSRVLQAKIAMSGKTLKLFLSLNPADFDTKVYFHKDMSHKKSYEAVPMLVKVKSNRGLKRALELITILMANNNVAKKSRYEIVNYVDELRALKGLEPLAETEIAEEVVAEEVLVEEVEVDDVAYDDDNELVEETSSKFQIERKPYVPFTTRILAANDQTKENYNTIKNELLSYRKLRCRVSKKCESYRLSRELQAKLVMSGATLKLFLSLNPADFDAKVYFHKDMSHKKAYEQTPLMIKLRSKRSAKRALELITYLMNSKEVSKKRRYESVDRIEELKSQLN